MKCLHLKSSLAQPCHSRSCYCNDERTRRGKGIEFTMKIEYLKSPNFEQVKRRNIKYIIIHYTGMKTAQESIKRLRSKKHKVSSHYFINERGKITQLVNDKDIAWHAGISNWKKDRNLNSKSIGIELQNKGKNLDITNSSYLR